MRTIGFAFTQAALDALTTIPSKMRRQIIKKAKLLQLTPLPQGCKKLHDVTTALGEAVYRQRSGDYRILYVVKEQPAEVIILKIDDRKDVYKMPKTLTQAGNELPMKERDFDDMMRTALGVPPPNDPVAEPPPITDAGASPKVRHGRTGRKHNPP